MEDSADVGKLSGYRDSRLSISELGAQVWSSNRRDRSALEIRALVVDVGVVGADKRNGDDEMSTMRRMNLG